MKPAKKQRNDSQTSKKKKKKKKKEREENLEGAPVRDTPRTTRPRKGVKGTKFITTASRLSFADSKPPTIELDSPASGMPTEVPIEEIDLAPGDQPERKENKAPARKPPVQVSNATHPSARSPVQWRPPDASYAIAVLMVYPRTRSRVSRHHLPSVPEPLLQATEVTPSWRSCTGKRPHTSDQA